MTDSIKYNCVFGGGGIRGLAYIGAVKAFEECGTELNALAGSSVGAVFAMLYAIGYNASEIKEFFMNFNFNIFRDFNVKIFEADISVSKGEIFLDWLREKIEKKFYGEKYKKGNNPPVCFNDLNRDLSILTLDINTNTPYIFSKENTPDDEVALAVRISAGMPGLMKPVQKNENILIDGDLIKTRPAFKIYNNLNNENTRLLELRLEGTRNGDGLKNPFDYLNSVISTIWYLSTEEIYNLYHKNDRYDYIIIDTKDIIMFDFEIDKEKREELIDKGYKTTKYYLTNTLVEKKKQILEVYKSIITGINTAKIYFDDDMKGALITILKILSFLTYYKEYADNSIYNELLKLQSLVVYNFKGDIPPECIKNQEQIKEQLNIISKLLHKRLETFK